MQVVFNNVDVTGLYVMLLEKTITNKQFEDKVESLTGVRPQLKK